MICGHCIVMIAGIILAALYECRFDNGKKH